MLEIPRTNLANAPEFRLLGPVELHLDGRVVDIGPAKRRAVLAALLLEVNRPVPVARLIEVVWGDDAPPQARNAVQGHVSALRRLLSASDAPADIETRAPGYVLRAEPGRVDAHRFTALVDRSRGEPDAVAVDLLTDALALWRGPALDGLPNADRLAARLTETRYAAVEAHADQRLRLGHHQPVVTDLTALVAADPLRESLVSRLMLALAGAGRQAEAIDLYHRTRGLLVDRLGMDPGPDLTEAYRRVLSPPARVPAPRDPGRYAPPVPRQLPARAAHFTARQAELATLRALADRHTGTPVRVVISGMVSGAAGVGKTALAVSAAHDLADRYPDGQFFADLRGWATAPPADPADVLAEFLRALDVPPDRMPADVDGRAALYRSLLAERRVLVVLDNARSSEQVRPLLPGAPGCLVLITGRVRLDGLIATEGAVPLPLSALPLPDAVELIARLAGPERCAADATSVRALAELCDRLPLALRIAATRLATHPEWPVAALVTALTDARNRLAELSIEDGETSVIAALDLTYAELPAPTARLFRLLSLHPGTEFGPAAVDALAGGSAAESLAVLVDQQLVQRVSARRYRMHDLVAAYADTRAGRDEAADSRDAAVDRLASFFLHTIRAAEHTISPDLPTAEVDGPPLAEPLTFGTPDAAAAWLTAERATAVELVRRAVRHGRYSLAWRLAHIQWRGIENGQRWSDGLELATLGAEAARACGDEDGRYRTLRFRAVSLTRLGRRAEAAAQYRELVALTERLNRPDLRVTTLLSLGVYHGRSGDPDLSLATLDEALAAAVAHGLRYSEAQVLATLAHVHLLREDPAAAYDAAGRAVAACAGMSVPQLAGPALVSQATAANALGRPEESLTLLRTALPLVRRAGIRPVEAETLTHLGDELHARGEHADARTHWRQAHTVLTELGDHAGADRLAAKLAATYPGDRAP